MKDQLHIMIELQEIDSAINKMAHQKKALPDKISELERTFTAEAEKVEACRANVEAALKRHKEKEEALKKGQEALKKTRGRQFEVKTNKEYEAVLKETEQLTTKSGHLEDEIIAALDEIERARTDLQTIEAEFDAHRKKQEEDIRQCNEELSSLDVNLQALVHKGQTLRGTIEPAMLRKYDAIKNVNYGLAVTGVWKEVCQGCRMNLPPQLYIELQRSSDIKYCPFCNRIIYWDDQSNNI